MAQPPFAVDFAPSAPVEVLAAMKARSGGTGWINLQPIVPDEHEERSRPTSAIGALFGAIFSSRGPAVPLCTWVPLPGDRPPHVEIGIQHAHGIKAARQLAEAGFPVPDTWRVLSDHPRRGLVVAVPMDVDDEEVLGWLIDAGGLLSVVPVTGQWRAGVFTR